MRYTPEYINTLNPNEIFVFGSNLAGIHGAGAARLAFDRFGAVWGVGIGHQGRSYALPTKDKDIETLSLSEINDHVIDFLEYARNNPQFTFLVTKVGCGLAGWTVEDIAPCFGGETPANVVLPREFYK
jgi:hypothetical protein